MENNQTDERSDIVIWENKVTFPFGSPYVSTTFKGRLPLKKDDKFYFTKDGVRKSAIVLSCKYSHIAGTWRFIVIDIKDEND